MTRLRVEASHTDYAVVRSGVSLRTTDIQPSAAVPSSKGKGSCGKEYGQGQRLGDALYAKVRVKRCFSIRAGSETIVDILDRGGVCRSEESEFVISP